jgi:hypothetical protein
MKKVLMKQAVVLFSLVIHTMKTGDQESDIFATIASHLQSFCKGDTRYEFRGVITRGVASSSLSNLPELVYVYSGYSSFPLSHEATGEVIDDVAAALSAKFGSFVEVVSGDVRRVVTNY